MATLEGTIALSGLPPRRGLIVSLCFYRVKGANAPAPYGGDPPGKAATDCHEVINQVDLETELQDSSDELPFTIERPPGFYYLQVRVILFRKNEEGKVFAQAEQFFFGRRPAIIGPESDDALTLPVTWPGIALEELGHYGTVSPQTKRPWWRLW